MNTMLLIQLFKIYNLLVKVQTIRALEGFKFFPSSICTVNKPHKTHFFHRDLCSALIESNKVLCCRSQKVDMDSFVSHFLKINISWKKYPLKTVISQVKRDQSCYFSTTSFQCSDRVDLKRRLYISKNDIINIYSTFAQKQIFRVDFFLWKWPFHTENGEKIVQFCPLSSFVFD